MDHVDAEVGFIEGEIVRLDAVVALQVDEVARERAEDPVLLLGIEGVGDGRAVGTGRAEARPLRREPGAHDYGHPDLLQAAGHLEGLGGMGVHAAEAGALERVGVLVGIPVAPGHLDAAEGHAHVIQAVVDHERVRGGVLDAEVAAEAGEDVAGARRVDGDAGVGGIDRPVRGEVEFHRIGRALALGGGELDVDHLHPVLLDDLRLRGAVPLQLDVAGRGDDAQAAGGRLEGRVGVVVRTEGQAEVRGLPQGRVGAGFQGDRDLAAGEVRDLLLEGQGAELHGAVRRLAVPGALGVAPGDQGGDDLLHGAVAVVQGGVLALPAGRVHPAADRAGADRGLEIDQFAVHADAGNVAPRHHFGLGRSAGCGKEGRQRDERADKYSFLHITSP